MLSCLSVVRGQSRQLLCLKCLSLICGFRFGLGRRLAMLFLFYSFKVLVGKSF